MLPLGMATVMTRPPEELDAGPILLQRQAVGDADAIADAVERNLDHLRPWMPWAADRSGHDPEAQRARLAGADEAWERGEEFGYLMLDRAGGSIVGSCGLHRRDAPRGLEIGHLGGARPPQRGDAPPPGPPPSKAALGPPHRERI